jgi:hypothetical protein
MPSMMQATSEVASLPRGQAPLLAWKALLEAVPQGTFLISSGRVALHLLLRSTVTHCGNEQASPAGPWLQHRREVWRSDSGRCPAALRTQHT